MQTAAIGYRVADFLKRHAPFESMDERDLLALAARGRVKFHETDEIIQWRGEAPGPFLFVIQQGSVSVWEEHGGEERLRDIRGPGDIMGLERFAGAAVHETSAKTNGDVIVYALPAADFEPLLEKYPAAMRYVGTRGGGGEDAAWNAPAGELAGAAEVDDLVEVREGATTAEALLAMTEANCTAVAVAGRGVVTSFDLVAVFGEDPAELARRIRGARDFETVRRLHRRMRGFLLSQLESAAVVDWLAKYASLIDEAILERALELSGRPWREFCWCFHGAAGRGESMAPVVPQVTVIVEGASVPREAVETLQHLRELLPACGYETRAERIADSAICASREEWESRFGEWISDPVRSAAGLALPYFDMRPVRGRAELWCELQESVAKKLREERGFTMLMAHDCLATLPPLTFFRDLVVEESGERTGVFRLEKSALRPLVDVARVFGIAAGRAMGSSSSARYEMARGIAPDGAALFREAADVLRTVLMHQARAASRQHGEGFDLPAAQFSAHERIELKNAFRTILRLLEFMSEYAWGSAR